jgi:putative glycerol-1-phosphate prenyltransferase
MTTQALNLPPAPPPWRRWRHITKLDPDRPLPPAALDLVLTSGTDAVIVGGTEGITRESVAALLARLQGAPVPIALEITAPEAAMPGASLYLVPMVLNAPSADWIAGHQAAAIEQMLAVYGELIPWHLLLPEPYLVLNEASAAARRTGAAMLTAARAAAYGALAGRLLRLPLLYVEYSGRLGDPSLLAAVREASGPDLHLVYGGGIASGAEAARMGALADTVVVGNLVYERPEALRETVTAIRAPQ